MKPTAIINTLPDCKWCGYAKKLLDLNEIQYVEVNEKSELWPTVPYVELDGKPIGGFLELAKYLREL